MPSEKFPPEIGVILVNIGSPDAPTPPAVRRYLKAFLSDPRVIDIPALWRSLLLHLVILPFRPKKSAAAYQAIWQEEGSPLISISNALADKVQTRLGDSYLLKVGMRYGQPSLDDALDQLLEAGCTEIRVVPLYPQYASASTGSSIEAILRKVAEREAIPALKVVPPFYDHPAFIESQAALARPLLHEFLPDHVLMSFHGLPVRQVEKVDQDSIACDREAPCPKVETGNRFCYRAHCFETARLLAKALGLEDDGYDVAFQSRLGRTPWIKPYTDKIITSLRKKGVERLAVICPSFTTDCLETLEEVDIRLKDAWLEQGGREFARVPS